MVTIHNRTARLLIPAGVRLLPGANKLSDSDSDKVKSDSQFQLWQQLGWVAVKAVAAPEPPPAAPEPPPAAPEPPPAAPEPPPNESESLGHLTVAQARPLIMSCNNPEQLLIWHEHDSRSTVQDMCEDRIRKLEAGSGG